MAVVELQEVVEVAAYLAGWLVVCRYIPAAELGHRLGQQGLLDQARDPELLLNALALLGLLLLLADELGDLHRRCCLGGQVVEELPVVGRVLLLGEARPQIEKPDQLALAHQGHDHLDCGFLHGPEGRRIQIELVDLDHPGSAGEVSHDRVVGRYLDLRGRYLLGSFRDRRCLLGCLASVASKEVLPESSFVFCLRRHLISFTTIVYTKRLSIVTKSVTTRRVRKTRKIALYFSFASSTKRLDGPNHSETWAGRIVSLTTPTKSSRNASRSVSSRSFIENPSSVLAASYFLL